MAEVPIILKPVHWFTEQTNGLFSIWYGYTSWKCKVVLRIYYLLIKTKDTVLFQMLEVKQRLFCVNVTPFHVLFEQNFNWQTYVVLRFSIFSVISFDFSGSLVTICSANVLTVTIRSAFTLTSCSRYYKGVFRILSNI